MNQTQLNRHVEFSIRYGKVEQILRFLDEGADINHRNEYGDTPLHHAAYWGNMELTTMFLLRGANVHIVNNHGESVLWKAANNQQTALIPILIEAGANPSFADAALLGDVEAGKRWIQEGADINAAVWNSSSPLDISVRKGHFQYVKMLLDKGAEVYPSLLYFAVLSGSIEILEMLLAERTWEQEELADALTSSVCATRRDMTELLSRQIMDWKAVVSYAIENPECLEYMVAFFLDKGIPLDNREELLQSALEGALHNLNVHDIEIIRILLDYGADATEILAYAIHEYCRVEVLQWLIERGADLYVGERFGTTPMEAALERDDPAIVRLLIESGHPPN